VRHNFTFSVTYSLHDKTLSRSDIKIGAIYCTLKMRPQA
jgi:hypothetical protein